MYTHLQFLVVAFHFKGAFIQTCTVTVIQIIVSQYVLIPFMYTEVQLSANMADEIWLTFGRIAIEIDGSFPVNCEENVLLCIKWHCTCYTIYQVYARYIELIATNTEHKKCLPNWMHAPSPSTRPHRYTQNSSHSLGTMKLGIKLNLWKLFTLLQLIFG